MPDPYAPVNGYQGPSGKTPPVRLKVSRKITIPDAIKVARHRRSPDLGPRILFFSGGSALRDLSRELIQYTHNSIHVITPFDSGGSSASLRRAFQMPAIGDVRNRLMALADQSIHGFPDIYRLFAYRFPKSGIQANLIGEFDAMIDGRHELVRGIPDPMRKIIRHHLRMFRKQMPESFDLRGASVGNLILTSGYLENERHLDPVIYIFSHLVQVRGVVRPVTNADLHLMALLADGDVVLGQHNMTGKEVTPLSSPIVKLQLIKDCDKPAPVAESIRNKMRKLIASADLICFPMGSFYTSVVANLLVGDIGDVIGENPCPKVFVPSTGADPEATGMSLTDQVEVLLRYIDQSASRPLKVSQMLNFVIVDPVSEHYPGPLDREAMERLSIQVIECPLVTQKSTPYIEETLLAPILLSLA